MDAYWSERYRILPRFQRLLHGLHIFDAMTTSGGQLMIKMPHLSEYPGQHTVHFWQVFMQMNLKVPLLEGFIFNPIRKLGIAELLELLPV